MLRDLLISENARTVIEIGLAYGSSALAIGEALASKPDAKHLVIDAFQDQLKNAGWDAITEAGLDAMCILLAERSQLVLPRLITEAFVADAAVVDGSHTFHNVFADLYFLREIVRPGGVIVLDDCHSPSVATAVRYFELNVGWHEEPVGLPPRLRAFRLPDPRIEPSFEDFKPFGIRPPAWAAATIRPPPFDACHPVGCWSEQATAGVPCASGRRLGRSREGLLDVLEERIDVIGVKVADATVAQVDGGIDQCWFRPSLARPPRAFEL